MFWSQVHTALSLNSGDPRPVHVDSLGRGFLSMEPGTLTPLAASSLMAQFKLNSAWGSHPLETAEFRDRERDKQRSSLFGLEKD